VIPSRGTNNLTYKKYDYGNFEQFDGPFQERGVHCGSTEKTQDNIGRFQEGF
jgi:hypothetical protein